MKNNNSYIKHTEITKELLNTLKVGDLVKINDWKKPLRVKGISENYVALATKQFKDTIYSIIEKKPWPGIIHNGMRGGKYHCSTDNMIFGDMDFNYNFDDVEKLKQYLNKFETGDLKLSEKKGTAIYSINIKPAPETQENVLRKCSHCGKEMSVGYCIRGGEEYYCSDDCLHEHYSEEEYLELYDNGNGDSYWTEWEESEGPRC